MNVEGRNTRQILVHVEGVNFDATISDVNDLATQRGASLALLDAPKALIEAAAKKLCATSEEVFTGASISRYLLNTDQRTDAVEKCLRKLATNPGHIGDLADVLPHLCFSFAAVDPADHRYNMREARYTVIAKAKRAQLQTPAVVAPAPVGHRRLCTLNPMLPAESDTKSYSTSVAARRTYGRKRKQGFHKDLGIELPDCAEFAHSLDDLVRNGPDRLPDTVRNKVAHIYLDGNDFTKIREKTISNSDEPLEVEGEFAKHVKMKRQRLLKHLIDNLSQCSDMFVDAEVADAEPTHAEPSPVDNPGGHPNQGTEPKRSRIFRWETLIWGGDEAAFVAPAWTLPKLLSLLAEGLDQDWVFGEELLTHKCGIFIADRKTPIALARRLAEALAESAKCPGANTVQIMISKSIEPPVDITGIDAEALSKYRDRLYSTSDPKHYTLDLSMVCKLIDGLRKIQTKPGGLPRSQLYGILRGEHVDKAFERSGAECKEVFESPIFGFGGSHLLPYQRVSELLDYFPLGEP